MSYVAIGVAGAGIVSKGISSIVQSGKAKRLEKANPFVEENANPLFAKNAAIAENMARTGMPQQQYNNALNNINRNQAGVLTMFGRAGARRGGLASILRGSNDATLNLDAQDAATRANNQRFSIGQNQALAQEQNRVWNWNKREKFLMLTAKSEASRGAANQNMMSAFNDASQLGAMVATGGMGGSGIPKGLQGGYQYGKQSGLLWNRGNPNEMNA
jgi:hypothetical protein